jgi:hypothetical protein
MDFSLPTLTTSYAEFVAAVKARDEDIVKMLDGTTSTNLPNGAKRWNATGKKFEKFDGTSWSDLTTLYEIKVADSNKLNGQPSTYYATADHNHNLVYAALLHTHDYSPSTHNHDSTYLGKTATAADSSKIGGYLPHLSAFGNTAAIRDANGDLTARYFIGALSGNASTATTAGSCSGNAATATTAANASKLNGQNFYWSGQGGQPTWVYGGSDGTNLYVYNPSNWSVNYANSSNYANSAGTISGGVGANVAALTVNTIGSYRLFTTSRGINITPDGTVTGSWLTPMGSGVEGVSGTWRCFGYLTQNAQNILLMRIA